MDTLKSRTYCTSSTCNSQCPAGEATHITSKCAAPNMDHQMFTRTTCKYYCATPTKKMIPLLHHFNTYFTWQDGHTLQELPNFKLFFDYRCEAPFTLHLYVDGYTKTRRLRIKGYEEQKRTIPIYIQYLYSYIICYFTCYVVPCILCETCLPISYHHYHVPGHKLSRE